jgi:hypothetical protein
LLNAEQLEFHIFEKSLCLEGFIDKFKQIGIQVSALLQVFKATSVTPEHRPIDFQTTDAGPGVSTNEQLVRLRMTESFVINDLHFQIRFHCAPRDSKAHKVEQVMSTLNEACGDGRFIDIRNGGIMETIGEQNVLKKVVDSELQKLKDDTKRSIARECAKKVANRYQGARCMGTVIHARTPDDDPYNSFYFDEQYLKQCSKAKSVKAKATSPGMGYFEYLQQRTKDIYIKYNNGIEGIRSDPNFRCPFSVKRIPAPVPKPSDNTGFNYF